MTVPVIYVRDDPSSSPKHIHTCIQGDPPEAHQWLCDSAYCERLQRRCTKHGGDVPRDATTFV